MPEDASADDASPPIRVEEERKPDKSGRPSSGLRFGGMGMESGRPVFVSPYNEAVLGRATDRRVRIFDTTLRDGEQTPGVALSVQDKVRIARVLDDLGVDTVEAGFPANSPGEFEAVRAIVDAGLKAEICSLNRCHQADIDASIKAEVNAIHVFIATSDIHLKHKLRMSREQVLEKATWAIDYAKAHGFTVEFSSEDATRTELPFLKQVHLKVQEAKVDRIDVADTVGTISPSAMRQRDCPLSTGPNRADDVPAAGCDAPRPTAPTAGT